jgi:hypothetical protein
MITMDPECKDDQSSIFEDISDDATQEASAEGTASSATAASVREQKRRREGEEGLPSTKRVPPSKEKGKRSAAETDTDEVLDESDSDDGAMMRRSPGKRRLKKQARVRWLDQRDTVVDKYTRAMPPDWSPFPRKVNSLVLEHSHLLDME